MNILFVEDEKDLSAVAVEQMETKGHRVIPVYDIAMAKDAILDVHHKIQVVIADHQLPDGQGIQFVEESRQEHPHLLFAVVSGCLTTDDEMRLQEQGIPFFHKPLIYSKVLEFLRHAQLSHAPIVPAAEPESEEVEPAAETVAEPEPKPKRKKLFGIF
ncbi:response regulator [Coraliomargarita akajimensis]|uniref:Response regulator receiver protein n=1 Tax=Coraliomargarita akajimensis (strain DSM 45221 / IAM 15411 / JCM 23193 / KCTC 12865 / 04OKA010-24) TaxID=583355 RepID=D5EIJ4_CORAD|nr:response regulator [Coraliomargarita akajimensis]ADE54260.1 response regulator receiver protein [Coraliomargarita akajimensis DSM 45221]